MNMIASDFIRTYCLNKFKANNRLSGDGTELIIPSIFIEDDYKRHMSINLESGLWRCFKTYNKGNFVKLYAQLEGITYKQAYEKFLFESFLQEPQKPVQDEIITTLPDTGSFEKVDLGRVYDDYTMALAAEFILDRNLDKSDFYVAKEGIYKDRLIIPFFNGEGKMFYFQARGLRPQSWPKYLNCKNLKMSQILYPFDYDSFDYLFVTEGVFDCLSLKACGFNATTTLSCHVSKEQMNQLKLYRGPIICAYDSDKAGQEGAAQFLDQAQKAKIGELGISVPEGGKDWNELYIRLGTEGLRKIALSIQPLDDLTIVINSI